MVTSFDENVILNERSYSCAPGGIKIVVEKMKVQGLKRCRDELTPIRTIHKEILSSALDKGLDLVAKVPRLSILLL